MNFKTESKSGLLLLGGFFFLIFMYSIWEYFLTQNVRKNGVYTKAIVEEVLGYKGGVRIEITYSYEEKEYSTILNFSGVRIAKSDQVLNKLLPDNPKAITLENNNISDCLKTLDAPKKGWTDTPTCN